MADPPLTDEEAAAILRAALVASEGLPPQGWLTISRRKDGSLAGLLKCGCHPWRLTLPARLERDEPHPT